jgi:NADPH oxidase
MWIVGPVLFYIIERGVRIYRGSQKTIVLQAVQHPSRVLEIRLQKPTFKYKPGEYVFLQCPYIADYEWHPFTISSAYHEGYIGVHMRIVGDWTGKVYKLLNPTEKLGLVQSHMVTAPDGKPIFLIDGPFGAASDLVFNYDTVMLWSGGIGVTPFAAILKAIKYGIEQGSCKVQRVEFFWTNRDSQAFEWFIELLADLEKKCPFLEINLFFTGTLMADQVRAIMFNDSKGPTQQDALTGLNARTTFGRPDFNVIFASKAQQYQGRTVGVFYCGPPAISKTLYEMCGKYTSMGSKTRFEYHKENF